jgi:hypothetical protein
MLVGNAPAAIATGFAAMTGVSGVRSIGTGSLVML